MSLTVTYKGTDIIDETADCVKVMKTQGKYLEDDVTIDYTGGTAPTLISKSINENGTYNASSDNADGYSSVTVNVPSDLTKLMTNTIEYIKEGTATLIPAGFQDKQLMYSNLVFFSVKTYNAYFSANSFRNAIKIKYANIAQATMVQASSFIACGVLKSLILTCTAVSTLQNTNAFHQNAVESGTGFVYVRDSLVNDYKVASNWSTYANQIKGFSEASTYDATTTYEIGDVCKYNGKFYGYCKSDLTSSTGNAPSGTTDDNAYWEYVADIEV